MLSLKESVVGKPTVTSSAALPHLLRTAAHAAAPSLVRAITQRAEQKSKPFVEQAMPASQPLPGSIKLPLGYAD